MNIPGKFVLTSTTGFITTTPEDVAAKILRYALSKISPATDFIVFLTDPVKEHLEDEGRSLITHIPGTVKKVFVKLDDFGDPSKWDEMYEPETVASLRQAPGCRFVVTFMLAEEY